MSENQDTGGGPDFSWALGPKDVPPVNKVPARLQQNGTVRGVPGVFHRAPDNLRQARVRAADVRLSVSPCARLTARVHPARRQAGRRFLRRSEPQRQPGDRRGGTSPPEVKVR